MITKNEARNAKVDWDYINRATEVKRTYLISDCQGREFFKMYKPSEAQKIFKQNGWKGKLVGILNKNRGKTDDSDRNRIRKNAYDDFMDHCRY